jgi:hypothetical protein
MISASFLAIAFSILHPHISTSPRLHSTIFEAFESIYPVRKFNLKFPITSSKMISSITLLTFAFTLFTTISADIFTVKASLPGNTFDGQDINAAGEAFWIGGSPATYCPSEVNPNCPNVTGTVLAAGFTALDVC